MTMAAHAGEITPLKNYDARGPLIYYHERSMTMQAARFDLAAPGELHSITVTLGGGKGSARLHIFGGEGGLNAPMLEKDLADPIILTKTKSGIERITVTLSQPIRIGTPQIFAAIDDISPNVRLLSDKRKRKPACRSGADLYYYQIIKEGNSWRWGTYGYAVELGFEFDRATATTTFSDVTEEVKLPDVALSNGGIAWSDISGDGFLDLFAGGRLFRNDGGNGFTDITQSAGISGHPAMQAFFDANRDASPDLLVIERNDTTTSCALYLNNGGMTFTRTEFPLPGVGGPTCYSIADVNRDGRLDLFIGGTGDSLAGYWANNLFINGGNGRFTRDTTLLRAGRDAAATIASQWVDYNNDGYLELFTVDADGLGTIWRNVEGKELIPARDVTGIATGGESAIRGTGCGWADYNNDGVMDLLMPGPTTSRAAGARSDRSFSQVSLNGGAPEFTLASHEGIVAPDYLEGRSGGAAADIDNDGLLDVILTTSCRCSYLNLFRQTSPGHLEEKTSESGLWRVAAGPDAVWADYDNDGAVDLAIMRDGKITLFHNNAKGNRNNYIDIDLDDPAGNRSGVGAVVTVHCGGAAYTREVTSGRGLAMQDPFRLHFGIGTAARVDSVTVRWPNGANVESFTEIGVNRINVLKSGRAAGPVADGAIQLHAAPNPFTERLTFTYSLPRAMHVRLDLYSSAGELVATLVDEDERGGEHSVRWEAKDGVGRRLPQGTYVYRLVTPAGELVGKAVLRL